MDNLLKTSAMLKMLGACFLILFASNALAHGLVWSSVTDLSPVENFSDGAQIAVSSDGTKVTAVWRRIDNSNATSIQSASATIIEGISNWGPVSVLSPAGQDANVPQISLSADGTMATVVWLRGINGSSSVIQSVSATISGNTAIWGSVNAVSAMGQLVEAPQIALSSDGTKATAIWSRLNDSNYIVQSASATVSGRNASWVSATDLSAAEKDANDPQIALSLDGTKATAIWYYRSNSSSSVVHSASAAIMGNTASWGSGIDLSDTGQATHFPQVSLSANGENATAVWIRWNGSNFIAQSASATIAGSTASWSGVTDLSASTQTAVNPQISLDSDGKRAAAIWSSDDGSNSIIQSASATIDGNSSVWGVVEDLTAAWKSATLPQISISSDGAIYTAVWQRWSALNIVIQSASASVVGRTVQWGSVVNLTTDGQNASAPQIAISLDSKKATAIWLRKNDANNIVQSASAIEKKESDSCYVIQSKTNNVLVFCL